MAVAQSDEEFPYLDSKESIQSYLRSVAGEIGVELDDSKLAAALDNKDKLASFRTRFCVPTIGEILDGQKIADGVLSVCCGTRPDSFYVLNPCLIRAHLQT